MSILIQLSEAAQRLSLQQLPPQNFVQMFNSVIHLPEFSLKHFQCKKIINLTYIIALLEKAPKTFIRDMEWKFVLQHQFLKLQICFFDYKSSNYLKANSQRLKLELMIILRIVNENLSNQEKFIINQNNGLLIYNFQISWKQFKVKVPKIQSLRRFLCYVISQLNKFRQLIYFCEPQAKIDIMTKSNEKIHMFDDYFKFTNNYRSALKNTKSIRQQNISIMGKIQQLRANKAQNQYEKKMMNDQIKHLEVLFQQNINKMYQASIGLEECAQNQQIKKKCKSHITKNQKYSQKQYKNQNSNQMMDQCQTKIVQGLLIIKKSEQNIISKQGAHSQITQGKFIYKLVGTINDQIVLSGSQQWISKNDKKAVFTIKRCKVTLQPSRNSFMNEIYFLNYIRDYHCSFIGRYYLKLKRLNQRNQRDQIYMKSYCYNIDQLLRKCKTLSIKERLSMIYQISLGLCFLNTKNVIHRDLKPHNIVVNQSLVPHIIDFGSCCSSYGSNSFNSFDKRLLTTKTIHIAYHQIPQTHSYIYNKMSKQQYEQHPLFDIYSFGKVMSFIMFQSMTPPNYQLILNDPHSQILTNLVFLIQMCLSIDPDQRPGFGQITGFLGSLGKFYNQFQSYLRQKSACQQQKMNLQLKGIQSQSQ